MQPTRVRPTLPLPACSRFYGSGVSRPRVYSLQEAAVGWQAPSRRPPRDRAQVLQSDPPWLHAGPTMRLKVKGVWTDFFPVGALARGLGRSVGTVRRLEEAGVIPATPYRSHGRNAQGQNRLYTRGALLAIVHAAEVANLVGRRPRRWNGARLQPE